MGTYLTDMADVIRAAGVPVVEQSGWQNRARSSGGYASGKPYCIMWHHTASGANNSAQSDADYMSYGSDSKPIANIMMARDGVAWVLAAGATNTNGKGYSCIFSKGTVPADSMNTHAIGMEIQNTGVGQTYSKACIDNSFKVSLALCRAYGMQPDDVMEHSVYAEGRKIDPATAAAVQGPWKPRSTNSSGSWNLDDLRDECRRRAGSGPTPPIPSGDDDMATAILHIEGRHAQFIGSGSLNPDGSVHCLLITWLGPGGAPFVDDHSSDPGIVHQPTLPGTLARDLVFLGNPEDINDSTGAWRAEDFYRVIRS